MNEYFSHYVSEFHFNKVICLDVFMVFYNFNFDDILISFILITF